MATDIKNDASLGASLVSCWLSDESSLTEDLFGSNTLTNNNTVTTTTGKQGTTASLNGTNQSLTLASFSVSNPLSIGFWIKEITRVDTPDPADANMLFFSDVQFAEASLDNGELKHADKNGSAWRATGVSITVDTWTHIIYASDTNAIEIFKNGVSVYTASGANLGFANFANGFTLGAWENPPSKGWADIDLNQVVVWSKKLNSTNASDLYNGGTGIPFEASASSFPDMRLAFI